jgi:exosortase
LKLVNDWYSTDNFSHGFLVPFIAAYMVLHNRRKISELSIRPNGWGYVLLIGAMVLHIIGNIGAELFTMRLSILLAIAGLTLILFGTRIFINTLVPHCYLILMIPIPSIIWNKIALPLQLMAAKLSAAMIDFIGIVVFREGNILHLTNTSLEVVDACSGLRSLTSMLALSAAFAYLSSLKNSGKWVLFLSAIPIAIAVNIVRLTSTAVMAQYLGPETAQGFLHEMSGILVFLVALVLLYLVFIMLNMFRRDRSQ